MSVSLEKMVKTSKFVSKHTQKKRRQSIKNEFESFDVGPLHSNFYFYLQQQNKKSRTALFYRIISYSINQKRPSFLKDSFAHDGYSKAINFQ